MPTEAPWVARAAARAARSRWYAFLRQVLRHHHRQEEASPFEAPRWLAAKCTSAVVQVVAAAATGGVAFARGERAAWSVKTWLLGYTMANLVSIPLLLLRLRRQRRLASAPDPEALREGEEGWEKAERAKTMLELFSAVWFVLGNVWLLDAQREGGGLYDLGIIFLAWNAAVYAIPFLVFLLLRCFFPLVGAAIGYDIDLVADAPGASVDDLYRLPHFLFQQQAHPLLHPECCICLTKYKEKEEVRELPCTHQFHLTCVDQWLKITAHCPLCKMDLLPR